MIDKGSMESTFRGKHCKRPMRVLKTTYEELQRLKLMHLRIGSCQSNSFEDLIDEHSAMSIQNAVDDSTVVLDLWLGLEKKVNSFSLGPMAIFWSSFHNIAEEFLDYIKSFRTGY